MTTNDAFRDRIVRRDQRKRFGLATEATKHTGRRRSVADLLSEATAPADAVAPAHLEDERDAGAVVVDIRPRESRRRDGSVPGAVTVDRDALEWRLDPQSSTRLQGIDYSSRVIVLCDDGRVSEIDARALRGLGVFAATSLAGGYRGWAEYHARTMRRSANA